MLRSVAVFGVAGAVNIEGFKQVTDAQSKSKTPPLTQKEMTAIEDAIGKKGKYVEAESVYTVSLAA